MTHSFRYLTFSLLLKKDKIIICGLPGCTNQPDKKSNITLVTRITLLWLYRNIFTTLTYLIPESHSKPFQVSKMVSHVENPLRVREIFCIFRHIQLHSETFSYVQAFSGTSNYIEVIQALLRHIVPFSEILRTLCNSCLCNHGIFRIWGIFKSLFNM